MTSTPYRAFKSALVLAGSLAIFVMHPTSAAQAAAAPAAPAKERTIEEITVTGSYLQGPTKDAALPLTVFTEKDLAEQGSPTIVELVQRIPAVNGGNIGESNRFLGGAPQGTATVNLRGLGLTRTLVLMNGQRLPTINSVGADYPDINQIPMAALAQVEVLRDGAAAVYGSDAVAGVVNFVTRRDLNGLELKSTYKAVQDSDGQYDASVAWGSKGDHGNVLLSAGYARKTLVESRKFKFMSYLKGPGFTGSSGAGNPGSYLVVDNVVPGTRGGFSSAKATTTIVDQGCAALGGIVASATSCRYPFQLQEASINDERHYQFFAEANFEVNDHLRFHTEGHWARNSVPHIHESVTLSTILFPTPIEASGTSPGGGTSPFPANTGDFSSRYYIPPTNPGLQVLMTGGGCPYAQTVCDKALANGLIASPTAWRPRALGGSPIYDGGPDEDRNETTSFRFVAGLDGDFSNGWGWTTRLTYGKGERKLVWRDLAVNRIQLGMRGLGGPRCNPNTGTPGQGGCLWFNPFANSIDKSIVNGKSYTAATGRPMGPLNSQELWFWMRQPLEENVLSSLLTFEGVLKGDFGKWELPGGAITWALGTQYRYIDRQFNVNDLHDAFATPCVDSAPYGLIGAPPCPLSPGVGAVAFRTPEQESNLNSDVRAVFGEIKLPIVESFEVSLAARLEDYRGSIGSTFNPRLALRWQALPWLAFRGSGGTTFRAPPQSIIAPGASRFQAQFTNPVPAAQGGTGALYRAVDIAGNPDLVPETAHTFNYGFILVTDDIKLGDFDIGSFNLSVDHFIVNFKKELSAEGQVAVYNALFHGSANSAAWSCDNDALRGRFGFVSGLGTNATVYPNGQSYPNCHPNNFNSVLIKRLNGASVDIKGLDFDGDWRYADFFGGELEIGAEASYLMSDRRSAVKLQVPGSNVIIDPKIDIAGRAELLSAFYSFPQWRTFAHAKYVYGEHMVRWTYRYLSGVDDRNTAGERTRLPNEFHDVTYRYNMPQWNLVVTGTIANVFDKEPAYITSQNNYDYANVSPLGRTFEIGIQWRMRSE